MIYQLNFSFMFQALSDLIFFEVGFSLSFFMSSICFLDVFRMWETFLLISGGEGEENVRCHQLWYCIFERGEPSGLKSMQVWLYLPFSIGQSKNLLKYIQLFILRSINDSKYFQWLEILTQLPIRLISYASQNSIQIQKMQDLYNNCYTQEIFKMLGVKQTKAFIDHIASLTNDIRSLVYEEGGSPDDFQQGMIKSLGQIFKVNPNSQNILKHIEKQCGNSDRDKKLLFLTIIERLIIKKQSLISRQQFLEGDKKPVQKAPKPKAVQVPIPKRLTPPKHQGCLMRKMEMERQGQVQPELAKYIRIVRQKQQQLLLARNYRQSQRPISPINGTMVMKNPKSSREW